MANSSIEYMEIPESQRNQLKSLLTNRQQVEAVILWLGTLSDTLTHDALLHLDRQSPTEAVLIRNRAKALSDAQRNLARVFDPPDGKTYMTKAKLVASNK